MPGGMRSDIAAVLRVLWGSLEKYVNGWRRPLLLLRHGSRFSVENTTDDLTRSFAGFIELLLLLFAVKKVSLATGLYAPSPERSGGAEPVMEFLGGVLGDFIALGAGIYALLFAVIAKGMANRFLGRHVPPFALMSIALTLAMVVVGGELFVTLVLSAALLLQDLLAFPEAVLDAVATLAAIMLMVILVRGTTVTVRLALHDLDVGPWRGALCLIVAFLVPMFPIAGVQSLLGTGE